MDSIAVGVSKAGVLRSRNSGTNVRSGGPEHVILPELECGEGCICLIYRCFRFFVCARLYRTVIVV